MDNLAGHNLRYKGGFPSYKQVSFALHCFAGVALDPVHQGRARAAVSQLRNHGQHRSAGNRLRGAIGFKPMCVLPSV